MTKNLPFESALAVYTPGLEDPIHASTDKSYPPRTITSQGGTPERQVSVPDTNLAASFRGAPPDERDVEREEASLPLQL